MVDTAAVDRFFCRVMELIPSAQYFPTDPEDNFKQSLNKKYHKNVKAQAAARAAALAAEDADADKHVSKRLKFNPKLQLTNSEQQLHEKEKEDLARQDADDDEAAADADAPEELTGLDGLRKRLAKKIETMRAKRQTVKEHKKPSSKKDKTAAASTDDPAAKKRKQTNNTNEKTNHKKAKTAAAAATAGATGAVSDDAPAKVIDEGLAISYGSLLVGQEKKEEAKTRNGRGLANIQNLLKKAEAKKARMEELKKTEEGRAVVQAKGWEKALKQAQGEKVLDDPKLLRNKLKKKLKQKDKSSKEWKQRVSNEKKQMKDRAKTKATNARTGKKVLRSKAAEARAQKIAASKPSTKGNRAGFEGKKGETFLNAKK
ncbi:Aste57867_7148 [Aphanomyces stellatus]|uniref:Aste57867_7148 protein n=1 Tax=Aphanomyces stellatus TaxID=120398 RepID=A0A485KHV8_9STRA|nr:hypothetical protein As57867_007124 [Aphanomyces stellatus]VFT84080.1 Aste57867_7148 [Aphanomyces stellatus]